MLSILVKFLQLNPIISFDNLNFIIFSTKFFFETLLKDLIHLILEPLIIIIPFKFKFFKFIHKIIFIKKMNININSNEAIDFIFLNQHFQNQHKNFFISEFSEIPQKIFFYEILLYFICAFIPFYSWLKLKEIEIDNDFMNNFKVLEKKYIIFTKLWVIFFFIIY